MSTDRIQHLFKSAKCTLATPALSSSLQLRFLQACSHSKLRLPQQTATQFCPYCSVSWVPGWTVSIQLSRSDKIAQNIRKNRLSKRARARKKKRKNNEKKDSGEQRYIVYHCLKCDSSCSFVGPSLREQTSTSKPIVNQTTATNTTPSSYKPESKPSSSKKRAKARKQQASLQNLLAQSKDSSAKATKGLKLDDFMKPS